MPVVILGRDRELAALDELLAQVAAGERATVMIVGEPGIGKTRLLDALAARALASDGVVAWGRAMEVGVTPAYWPWHQVFAALATSTLPAPNLDGTEDAMPRLARFGEVVTFLRARAAHKPIAILLDDVHRSDPSSLELLEHVLPRLVGARVLVAIAARDADATREIAGSLARVQRGARRFALGRLGKGDVATMLGAHAPVVDRVFELSAGNPLFVEELVASLDAGGVAKLPQLSSVRAVIRERVERLPAAAQRLLVAGALLGRDFAARVVGAMAEIPDPMRELAPAIALGFVSVTGPMRLRFSHALVAEALADDLEPSAAIELHRAAARALEVHDRANLGGIAHHLLGAGAPEAIEAARRAAREAMAQLAFETAATILERALDASNDPIVRANLSCDRAEALQHASRHDEAATLCDAAIAVAREASDPDLFARAVLVLGLEMRYGHPQPRLVALLAEAHAGVPANSPSRAKILARWAAAEQPAPDPERPCARAREAIALAAELPPRDRLDVLYVAMAALIDHADPSEVEPILVDTLALARGRDRGIVVHTMLRRTYTALAIVDRAAFDRFAGEFADEAHALGLARWTRHVPLLRSASALLDGRFADSDRAIAETEAIDVPIGDANAAFTLTVHRLMAAWTRTAAIPDSTRSLAGARLAPALWVLAMLGDDREMRTLLDRVTASPAYDHDMLSMVAVAVAIVGTAEEAASCYERLSAATRQICVASQVGSAVQDIVDRLLLQLASRAGRFDVIEEHARTALAIAAKLGSPVWAARVRADFAEALERRDAPGDRTRATELWASARVDAERFGMPKLLARAMQTHAAAPKPAPAPARIAIAKQGTLWIVRGFDEEIHVKDSRGMQMIARLVEAPGVELHALDLGGGFGDADGGDAGPALDEKARNAYRRRLADLGAERDQAEAWGDPGRLARVEAELEMLTAELERALGLGGRERRVGAASERARINVQRRIAHALEAVRAGSARIGEHLTATIRTGTYCRYAA